MTISVVVVDDDSNDRYVVRRMLDSLQLPTRFVEYSDGHAFIDAVADTARSRAELGMPTPPTLVLLDINMPRMSGFEVLEALHSRAPNGHSMMILMYSSSSQADDLQDAAQYELVHDYIVKPLKADKLREVLEQHYPDYV